MSRIAAGAVAISAISEHRSILVALSCCRVASRRVASLVGSWVGSGPRVTDLVVDVAGYGMKSK